MITSPPKIILNELDLEYMFDMYTKIINNKMSRNIVITALTPEYKVKTSSFNSKYNGTSRIMWSNLLTQCT